MPTVLVTGANRGLGLEFVRQYAADGWRVIAVCRSPSSADALLKLADGESSIAVHAADVTKPADVAELGESLLDTTIDVLINNAGIFGPSRSAGGGDGQTFGSIDYERWLDVLRVNSLAPMMLAETLLPNVRAAAAGKLVTISSRLGSIAQTGAGYYAYRSSKAAVNMAMATLAQEPAASGVTIAVLHPGWVSTDMGGPEAPVTPTQSVTGLRQQIERLDRPDSGGFFDFEGERLPW
ncbi:MAG: SDR family oxidoreductase [Pseudomonadota bacterium]